MEVRLKDVLERDMDFLFMEEFVSEQEFTNLFLKRIGKANAKVIEVKHSETDVEYGESDITVIVEYESKRHALLIEDKIDAIAMKEQCARYFRRGEKGIQNKKFDGFDVFIIAPQKYLNENQESKKYPNRISYEEVHEYFSRKTTDRNIFKKKIFRTM